MKYIYIILSILLFTVFVSAQQMRVHKTDNSTVTFNLTEIDSITFSSFGSFTDPRDGKVYKTVIIGSQTWMAENLNYRPTSGTSWYYYNDSATYSEDYGRLYDWSTALTAAPAGWHLPSDSEWTTLITYLGGAGMAGRALKEAGTAHWTTPNDDVDNSTGFTALPGGYNGGSFYDIGNYGYWWSSTNDEPYAWSRHMYYGDTMVSRDESLKYYGFSVRCVKD
jgi:uncharacterized protein (TIGR02145 family)